jgi:hypothetical protein
LKEINFEERILDETAAATRNYWSGISHERYYSEMENALQKRDVAVRNKHAWLQERDTNPNISPEEKKVLDRNIAAADEDVSAMNRIMGERGDAIPPVYEGPPLSEGPPQYEGS